MSQQPHFIVGNRHEGCGHCHKTLHAARLCHKKTPDILGFKTSVYLIYFENGKRRWKRL